MDIHLGKCPYCKATISKVRLETVEAGTGPLGTDPGHHAVSYSCLSCSFVLSVSIDPISLNQQMVSDLVDLPNKG
jgi:hypothetical protein